jgi:hypothetical protein
MSRSAKGSPGPGRAVTKGRCISSFSTTKGLADDEVASPDLSPQVSDFLARAGSRSLPARAVPEADLAPATIPDRRFGSLVRGGTCPGAGFAARPVGSHAETTLDSAGCRSPLVPKPGTGGCREVERGRHRDTSAEPPRPFAPARVGRPIRARDRRRPARGLIVNPRAVPSGFRVRLRFASAPRNDNTSGNRHDRRHARARYPD